MNLSSKVKAFILGHKIISSAAILILLGAGYWIYASLNSKSGETRYVLAATEKGTIISSVSGTGQVSTSNQVDIKPEISGKITYINIQKGVEVEAGTLLAQIDSRDAQKTVQSAENDLANAQLSTTDIQGTASDALDTSYDGGLTALANTYKDLTAIKTNLDPIFQTSSYGGTDSDINYYLRLVKVFTKNPSDLSFWANDAEQKYKNMQDKLDAIENAGWLVSKNSQPAQIDATINDTYTTSKTFLDLIRQALNLTQEYQKLLISENLTALIQTATTATQITNLSAAVLTLSTDTSALLTAKTDITTKKQAVAKIGTDTQSQNLNILQYQNALADAKDALAKYYIYATIDGIISAADTTIETGNTISSGTTLGSIITKQQILEISLSETDIPKIKTGDKVIVTFDAINNLSISGKVTEIDSVGTVSQGVVSYNVKITFDTQDGRIKPGMSASVNIITDIQQNVLTVPNSAVKSKNGSSYVLVLSQKQDLTSSAASQGFVSAIAPTQKTVQIGVADDTNTQIISGLAEGDQVVTRTISGATATAPSTKTSSATSATRLITGGGGGGFGGRPGN